MPEQRRQWAGRPCMTEVERLAKVRARISPMFIRVLQADFSAHGAEAFAAARERGLPTYLLLSAALLPQVVEDVAAPPRSDIDAEIERLRAQPIEDDGFTTIRREG